MKKVLKSVLFAVIFFACGFILQQFINGGSVAFWKNQYSDINQRLINLENQTSPVKWQVDMTGVFSFCGSYYALSDWFFRERLQDELWRLYDRRGWLFIQYQRLGRYRGLIEAELTSQDLPRDLIYLYVWESGLDPKAQSWANAVGIPQFIKSSAAQFRLSVNSLYDERKDPKKSIEASCWYLKQLYDYFGDWLLAMASYNHGLSGVKSKMEQQMVSDYIDLSLPTETYKYVFQIMAVRYVIEQGIMGDMSWLTPHSPLPASSCVKTRIKNTVSLYNLSQEFKIDFDTFRLLNPHLPARLNPGNYPVNLPVKSG